MKSKSTVMILLLITWLIKNYRNRGGKMAFTERMPKVVRSAHKKFLPLFFEALLFIGIVNAQERTLQYKVMHKGKPVGSMVFHENTIGKNIHIKIESEVRARIILNFTVKIAEEAIFREGVLIYSSILQKVNGNEQINRLLQASGSDYKEIGKVGNTHPLS